MADQTKVKASDHESYTALSLVAFFIPIAGIIVGIIYTGKTDPLDRKLGNALIVLSIISAVLISTFFYFNAMAQTSQIMVGI